MPTENLTITCLHDGSDYNCTLPLSDIYAGNVASFNTPFFSAGEMFISLCLLIGIVLAIITMVRLGIFTVKVHKEYQGVNELEGKQKFRI